MLPTPETNHEDPYRPVINHVSLGIECVRRVLLRNLRRPSRSEEWRLRFLVVSPVQLRGNRQAIPNQAPS
jgi:hypothetical protein